MAEALPSLDVPLSSISESEILLALITTESSSLLLVEGRFKRPICTVVEKCVDIRFPYEVGVCTADY